MLFDKKQRLINRILIVEDEPLIAFENEYALHEAGYQVVATVDRYRDAMTIIAAQPVDLILCDVTLTGIRSGIDLARDVKPLGIRLLFMTATCPPDAAELSIGCLRKPYSSRELLGTLDVINRCTSGGKPPKKLPAGLVLYAVPAV